MSKVGFEKNEVVVCPAYGVGVVQGIEHQEIMGTQMDFVVVFFEKDRMTVRLPINENTCSKVRKLSSKSEIEKAIKLLSEPAKVKKMMWSRRAQEYEMKINSGEPISIAEVVRDLYRTDSQPEHSYSERQIYQEAFERLAREYAAIAKIDEKKASAALEQILLKKAA